MRRYILLAIAAVVAVPIVVALIATSTPRGNLTHWGGVGAVSYYGSYPEWRNDAASRGLSIAVVRVTRVSDLRWSTASGNRPGQREIDAVNRGEAEFTIGRLITVEIDRQVEGTPPAGPYSIDFWLPGGQMGNDYTPPSELLHDLPSPTVGARALATLLPSPADLDGGSGTLMVEVAALFPVNDGGVVLTPRAGENIRVDSLMDSTPLAPSGGHPGDPPGARLQHVGWSHERSGSLAGARTWEAILGGEGGRSPNGTPTSTTTSTTLPALGRKSHPAFPLSTHRQFNSAGDAEALEETCKMPLDGLG